MKKKKEKKSLDKIKFQNMDRSRNVSKNRVVYWEQNLDHREPTEKWPPDHLNSK